ncbi:MAG: helix-turn-helix transcriptional regulator [Proteobacteria bacterium]|nr:helix-turn-helix transcriptional regulator [Luminiphilus sp.]MBL6820632.1 helix-turn-helix transcriptional regulator [Luminiphilus sp.]MDA0650593.1 helix-turn-helix transcriptional regulator [Pseudomonadota bacterium]
MGQAISTSALWGAKPLLKTSKCLDRFERTIDAASDPFGLGPMLVSTDVATILDALCADSNLPLLKLAEAQDHRVSGVMAPLIERSKTVADALRVVLMFNCRHAEPLYWTGSMRGDHAALTAWLDRPADISISQAERMCVLGVFQLVAGFKSALGDAFQPTLIRIKPCWSGTEWPSNFLGVPIQSNAPETELLMSRACLTLPNPLRREIVDTPELVRELDRYQEDAKAELLRNDTCSWIRGHLPSGDCDLTQLAARLNCDKRTLQRRFERELSCRFSDLVDDVRAEMCVPLLDSGVFPMQTIAEQLGYATSGNFSRFFQRRFGCTPRDWTRLALTA